MVPSEGAIRSRNRWREYQERRRATNWTKMSYYDYVDIGDLVKFEPDSGYDESKVGLVVETADTVKYEKPDGCDTLVHWFGEEKPSWELTTYLAHVEEDTPEKEL